MEWQTFIKNLVNGINVDESIANSYKDYHAKGVDYLNLLRTKHLTVKYLSCSGKSVERLNKSHDVIINPHTSQYNQTIILLDGELELVTFDYITRAIKDDEARMFSNATKAHNRFSYTSPIKYNKRSAEGVFKDTGYLTEKETIKLKSLGDSVYIEHNEIQSYRVFGDTKFLVLQYLSLDKLHTEHFQQSTVLPMVDGLYTRYTPTDVRNLVNTLDEFVSNKYTHSFALKETGS